MSSGNTVYSLFEDLSEEGKIEVISKVLKHKNLLEEETIRDLPENQKLNVLSRKFSRHLFFSNFTLQTLGRGKLVRTPTPSTSTVPTPPDLTVSGQAVLYAEVHRRKKEAKRYANIFKDSIAENNSHYRGLFVGNMFHIRHTDSQVDVFSCPFVDFDVKNAYGQFAVMDRNVDTFVRWVNTSDNTIPDVFNQKTP